MMICMVNPLGEMISPLRTLKRSLEPLELDWWRGCTLQAGFCQARFREGLIETEGTFVCFADGNSANTGKADIALARRALISGFQPKM